ncbi:MAG: aminotransferase class I/II-fold pyridoxal phosphate-dependent enzyme [Candidatus Moranbacteria bacterium]|nr:aminotransferase class I/II-fold pyridoxal phosphate-dependent enzyme [Candidatus Moranbacteria bacterium]
MAENKEISLSPIKDMELRASRIPGVVSLAQGVPSFDTPDAIKNAAIEAIQKGKVAKYSLSPGLLELREVITQKLEEENKYYDFEEEVIVTAGSIEAITATMLAIISPGDEVLIPDPTYTSYQPAIKVAGGVPVFVPLDEENHWAFNIAELEKRITPKTKALLFCNPNNPTGTIFTRNQLHAVAQLAIKHDFHILSDEVYKDFIFDADEKFYSLAEMRGIRDRLIACYLRARGFAVCGAGGA